MQLSHVKTKLQLLYGYHIFTEQELGRPTICVESITSLICKVISDVLQEKTCFWSTTCTTRSTTKMPPQTPVSRSRAAANSDSTVACRQSKSVQFDNLVNGFVRRYPLKDATS